MAQEREPQVIRMMVAVDVIEDWKLLALRHGQSPVEELKQMVETSKYIAERLTEGGKFLLVKPEGEQIVIDFHAEANPRLTLDDKPEIGA